MRLPNESELTTETARALYQWDLRECFATDPRHWWTIHYRNRLDKILKTMSDFVPVGGQILDIGCAQATAALMLAERGFRVTAVDANQESLDYAQLRHESGDINFVCMDAMKLSLKGPFDAILLGEVIEHVPRPGTLLRECVEMLRPNGIIVVTTPNGRSLHNWRLPPYDESMEVEERADVPSGIGVGDGALAKLEPNPLHLFCFRRRQLSEVAVKCGLTLEHSELLNSYVVNPIQLHKILPLKITKWLNQICSQIPVLADFTTMALFVVGKKN